MNKWIKISFSGATLHYRECGVTTGDLLKSDKRFDSVHHYDMNQKKIVSGDRLVICPETILTDEFKLIDDNGKDVTKEIREKKDFSKYLSEHPEIHYVYGGDKYGSIFRPFNANQIANMLAVFIGEKPVSTYHPKAIFENGELSYEKINQSLIDIVNNGFIKLDTPFYYEKNQNGQRVVLYNINQLASGYPSNSKKRSIIQWWETTKANLSEDKYKKLICMLEEMSGECDIENKYSSLTEFLSKIVNEKGYEFIEKELKKNQYIGLLPEHDLTYLRIQKPRPFELRSILSAASECKYLGKTIQLSGSFIFKVPEDIYKKLINGKKTAIYLENGFATLAKWDGVYGIDEEYFVDTDFTDYYSLSEVISGKTNIGMIKSNNKKENNDTEDLL